MSNQVASITAPLRCIIHLTRLLPDPDGTLSSWGFPCYYCPKCLYAVPWDFEKNQPYSREALMQNV